MEEAITLTSKQYRNGWSNYNYLSTDLTVQILNKRRNEI
ncbi:hypothetical protein M2E15_5682 [Bacillus mycoides]|nr:hypothetical protein M2E15_5682 [Bacillus mycoides]KZD43721.1 hypothetical protein B4083_1121 [Bacillus cereus]KZE05051.1 hypothetical protein B4117_2872 [Bacillus mycoides]